MVSVNAYYAKRIAGREVARIKIAWEPDEDELFAFIESVFVRPDHRARGHARALMGRVLADADRDGVELQLTALPLEQSTTKSRLVGFYRSFGFAPIAGSHMRRKPQEHARRI
jgi:GNAT superfamily N-acetyltransferase